MLDRSNEIADRLGYFFGLSDNIPERKRRLFIGMHRSGIFLLVTDTLLSPLLRRIG